MSQEAELELSGSETNYVGHNSAIGMFWKDRCGPNADKRIRKSCRTMKIVVSNV